MPKSSGPRMRELGRIDRTNFNKTYFEVLVIRHI